MQTGKAFLVENRPGASGSIAAGAVAKSAPDGHTLIMVPSTYGTASALYDNLPYTESELVPVGLIGSTPYVFVVHPSIPVSSFGELIALLKKNPGKYEFASSSPGTAQHLGGELVKRMAGVDMLHVPYKGSGALLPDLLSGRVPMMFENVAIMTPHIKKGSLKPLAISSAKRSALLPGVPTVAETGQGLEGFEVLGWFAADGALEDPARSAALPQCRAEQDDHQAGDRHALPGARRRADGRHRRAGRRLHPRGAGQVGQGDPRSRNQGQLTEMGGPCTCGLR